MRALLTRFLQDDRGATAIEYGLLVALIAMVIVGSFAVLGTSVSALFSDGTTGPGDIISDIANDL